MEEINFIRPEEIFNRNTGESKVRYRSYDGNDRFIPVVEGEDGVPKTLTKVTWQELKNKRDASKLTPGALYRITDYQCTTTQENTRSAGHQFDIVLLALSENKLAEEGWAMMNESNIYDMTFADGVRKVYILKNDNLSCNIVDVETLLGYENYIYHNDDGDPEVEVNWENHTATNLLGETFEQALTEENVLYNYFQNSNLSAWKVWYCLDNDKSRFAWADATNGKGVIYRLVDEFNNDLPCDFKNILVIIKAVESYLITAINHDDDYQDYSMLGKIRGITVSLCLHTDGLGNNKNAVPIGSIAPSLRPGVVLYNIKISSSALEDAGLLTDISSNTIIGYTI